MEEQNQNYVVITNQETSPTIGKLAEALSQAQGEMEAAVKDSSNPFFKSKYADLTSVWAAIRKPFSKNKLAIIQTTGGNDGATVTIVTRLVHASGEWVKGELTLRPTKNDPQGIGSTLSYGRRYSLAAICGVVQEDDDGNSASGKQAPKEEPKAAPVTPKIKPAESLQERVTNGIKKLAFSVVQKETLLEAFKDDQQTLLNNLTSIFKSQDQAEGKDLLLDMAEGIIMDKAASKELAL